MSFAIIVSIYVSVGALAAVGSGWLAHRFLPIRFEPIVFGLFLVPIAGFYLAFTAYFGNEQAWSLESTAVIVFAVLGTLGMRIPAVLVIGYIAHGAWDMLHEIHDHAGTDVFGGRAATQIPLAYGSFCATFDWCMAGYFVVRQAAWAADRKASAT